MPRRVRLPEADDIFRATDRAGGSAEGKPAVSPATSKSAQSVRAVPDAPEDDVGHSADDEQSAAAKAASGRVRHDEKMTVYVTSDELIDIEHARLGLRARHRLSVDRGRLVREAVALVLADLEANGDDSMLVRRLSS